MTTLSIQIGSKALETYGYPKSESDYDFLVNNDVAKELIFKCSKKEKNLIWIDDKVIDLAIITDTSTTNFDIMEFCNKNQDLCKKGNMEHIGDFLIPPLEILYVIKKSHIHRVISLTGSKYEDINIWKKQMNMYIWMREHLDYKRMDTLVYEQYKLSGVVSSIVIIFYDTTTELEKFIPVLFRKRFDETNSRIGDTVIDIQKNGLTKKEFFNDGVERFVNHDTLHETVSLKCRETTKPLFEKYQNEGEVATDTNNEIELSKSLFYKATLVEQIQTMREEIMVLMLERKWICELIKCYKENGIQYNGYDEKQKLNELDDIISHFITNLCGQGHYWLRNFCLDHYKQIGNAESYDLKMLEDIALSFTNIKIEHNPIVGLSFTSFRDKLLSYDGYNNKIMKSVSKVYQMNKVQYFGKGDGVTIFNNYVYIINKYEYIKLCVTMNAEPNNEIKKILTQMSSNKIISKTTSEYVTIYDLKSNIGFHLDDKGTITFYLIKMQDVGYHDKQIKTIVEYIILDPKQQNEQTDEGMFKIKTKTKWVTEQVEKTRKVENMYYSSVGSCGWTNSGEEGRRSSGGYYSSTGSCGWTNPGENDYYKTETYYEEEEVEKKEYYLSSYGNIPHFAAPMCEYIAKKYLDI